jgi:hypothetical protein
VDQTSIRRRGRTTSAPASPDSRRRYFFSLDEIEVVLFLDKKIELGTRERSLDEVIDCQSRWLNWLADVTIKQ